jgi:hypothetical protein
MSMKELAPGNCVGELALGNWAGELMPGNWADEHIWVDELMLSNRAAGTNAQ